MRPRLPSAIGDLLLWFGVLALAFAGALLIVILVGLTCENGPCADNLGAWDVAAWATAFAAAAASLLVDRPRPLLLAAIVLFAFPVLHAVIVLIT